MTAIDPAQLRAQIEELGKITPRLNAAADRATTIINQASEWLGALGLGINATSKVVSLIYWEKFEDEERGSSATDDPYTTVLQLEYGRFNGRYCIHVWRGGGFYERNSAGAVNPLDERDPGWSLATDEYVAFSSCKRHEKIELLTVLPDLIRCLLEQASKTASRAESEIASVETFLGEIGIPKPTIKGESIETPRTIPLSRSNKNPKSEAKLKVQT